MSSVFEYHELLDLIGNRLGVHDVPCSACGPSRRSPINQRRRVLRIWNVSPGFISFSCARCGENGFAVEGKGRPVNPSTFARVQAEVAERDRVKAAKRLERAQWLYRSSLPAPNSPVETYLRDVRKFDGSIPATLRYLPSRNDHPLAMIAPFGIPQEIEPGVLSIATTEITGVHITRLKSDGSGKAGTSADKIMLGNSAGWPIVLASPNDLLGLAITEGIEDALSVHEATGLGAWAAGSASRLPGIADRIPEYIECVTTVADDDDAGRRHARSLQDKLQQRGIECRCVLPATERQAA